MYTLDSSRTIDWTLAGVPGGIPNRTTVWTTLAAGSTAAQIASAISACPSGQVVMLSAGTYTLTGTINIPAGKSGVTLRGAGPRKGSAGTILTSPNGGNAIRTSENVFPYGSGDTPPSGSILLTSGYTKGSTQVLLTANATSAYVVGNLICFSQLDDHVLVWNRVGQWHGNWSLTHEARITGVSGAGNRVIDFTPPIPYSYAAAQTPRVNAMAPSASLIGIENMTINCNGGDGMYLDAADRCWVKNVEMYNGGAGYGHIVMRSTVQCEISRCYIHDCNGYPTEDEGYGIYLWYANSAAKIEDNIFYRTAMGILNTSSSSCYYGYNFAWQTARGPANWYTAGMHCNHGAHGIMDLWEGNMAEKCQNDGYHGSTSHQVWYRNNIHGVHPGDVSHHYMMNFARASYYHSVIGNVIGNQTNYPVTGTAIWYADGYSVPTSGQLNSYCYKLGWPDSDSWGLTDPTDFPSPWAWSDTVDTNVAGTIIRHANWDNYNRAVTWNGADDHTIPNSMVYTSKPSFFGTLGWPAIGPDVSGYITDIPAKNRWQDYLASGNLDDLFADQPAGDPSFSLTVVPTTQTVSKGAVASYTVTSVPETGFTGDVTLSVTGLPVGTSASFVTNPIAYNANTAMTIPTTAMSVGTFSLTVNGEG